MKTRCCIQPYVIHCCYERTPVFTGISNITSPHYPTKRSTGFQFNNKSTLSQQVDNSYTANYTDTVIESMCSRDENCLRQHTINCYCYIDEGCGSLQKTLKYLLLAASDQRQHWDCICAWDWEKTSHSQSVSETESETETDTLVVVIH